MKFQFLWGKELIIKTIFFNLTLLTIPTTLLYNKSSDLGIIALLCSICCILVAYFKAPKYLIVEKTGFTIVKNWGKIVMPIDHIINIERVPSISIKKSSSFWSNKGLFGFYGKHKYVGLGYYQLYATKKSDLVMLSLSNGKTVIINCEDPIWLRDFYYKCD